MNMSEDLKDTIRDCVSVHMSDVEIVEIFQEVPHYLISLIKTMPEVEKAIAIKALMLIEEVRSEPPPKVYA